MVATIILLSRDMQEGEGPEGRKKGVRTRDVPSEAHLAQRLDLWVTVERERLKT